MSMTNTIEVAMLDEILKPAELNVVLEALQNHVTWGDADTTLITQERYYELCEIKLPKSLPANVLLGLRG